MPFLSETERIGTLVNGRYRVGPVIGRGAMGIVYRGEHIGLGKAVAIKFLRSSLCEDPGVVERFLREGRAASRIQHPNAVDVRDVDRAEDGVAYLVLELLQGETLEERLRRSALRLEEARAILAPVMNALAAGHDSGVVHRDLKPGNIFLARGPSGESIPKVVDFGIAHVDDGRHRATRGMILGTPGYLAPEQAKGDIENIGPWSDIWSMAVVLYECLTLRLPFDVATDAPINALIFATVEAPIVPIELLIPSAPDSLRRVMARALERNRAQRYQSMRELCADFAPPSTDVTIWNGPTAISRPHIGHALPPTAFHIPSPVRAEPLVCSQDSEKAEPHAFVSPPWSPETASESSAGTESLSTSNRGLWVISLAGILAIASIAALMASRQQPAVTATRLSAPASSADHHATEIGARSTKRGQSLRVEELPSDSAEQSSPEPEAWDSDATAAPDSRQARTDSSPSASSGERSASESTGSAPASARRPTSGGGRPNVESRRGTTASRSLRSSAVASGRVERPSIGRASTGVPTNGVNSDTQPRTTTNRTTTTHRAGAVHLDEF